MAYDGQNAWADLDATNALVTRRLYGDSVDQLLARITGGTGGSAGWYLTDHLGSVRNVTDSTGALTGTLSYDPFGNALTNTGSTDRYQFTGREVDSVTGLQYNRARYYNAAAGRWTSDDPEGFDAGDDNLYRYVGNNGTNATDPKGLGSRGRVHYSKEHYQEEADFQLMKGVKDNNDWVGMNKNVTKAYAYLAKTNPRVYQWMTAAALASAGVGRGMRTAEIMGGVARVASLIPGLQESLCRADMHPRQVEGVLALGNVSIFKSMYWMHLAYQNGGIQEIERLAKEDANAMPPPVLAAWREIARGDQLMKEGKSEEGELAAYNGNYELAVYEQKDVLQKVFDKYPKEMKLVSTFVHLKSPIPADAQAGAVDFPDYVPGGDFGNFNDRWKWFGSNVIPAFRQYMQKRPKEVQQRLDRLSKDGEE
jgi:RHS repeat-associated protein